MHAADFALTTHTHPDATTTASGFMSAADKSKLDSVQAGAEVNQLAYSHISVGSTTVSASSKTDTLSLVAGSNIGIAADAAARQLTFSVSPQGAGSGLNADLLDGLHAAAFALASHEHSLSVLLASELVVSDHQLYLPDYYHQCVADIWELDSDRCGASDGFIEYVSYTHWLPTLWIDNVKIFGGECQLQQRTRDHCPHVAPYCHKQRDYYPGGDNVEYELHLHGTG
jgi:hypothetical protein